MVVFGFVVMALTLLLLAAFGLVPDPGLWAVLGALAGWITLLLAQVWRVALRVRKRWRPDVVTAETTGSEERGVRIPQSAGWWTVWAALIVYTNVLVLSAPVLALIFEGPVTDPRFYVVLPIFGFLSLVLLKFLFDLVRGRQAPSRLLLTARGVYYHAGARHDEVFVPWGSIRAVKPGHGPLKTTYAVTPYGPFGLTSYGNARIAVLVYRRPAAVEQLSPSMPPARRAGRPLRMHGNPGDLADDVVLVRAQQLAVDPALAYYAIIYYWYRPDARAELGTEAGLRRIRSGELMVWFPAERAMVLDAVRALANNESRIPVTVAHEPYDEFAAREGGPAPSGRFERLALLSHSDDLLIHMKNLFDETRVLPDPREYTGRVVERERTPRSIGLLYEDELPALRRLGVALDPLVRDLGGRPSWHYQADPRWSDVVHQAACAAQVMEAHG